LGAKTMVMQIEFPSQLILDYNVYWSSIEKSWRITKLHWFICISNYYAVLFI